jgi:hypothetical protein
MVSKKMVGPVITRLPASRQAGERKSNLVNLSSSAEEDCFASPRLPSGGQVAMTPILTVCETITHWLI